MDFDAGAGREIKEGDITMKEKSKLAPFDRPRSEELKMTDDAYISRFGTDGELGELRKKIESRRFAFPKKGMKTAEEIRARLYDMEARAEKVVHASGARTQARALEAVFCGSI